MLTMLILYYRNYSRTNFLRKHSRCDFHVLSVSFLGFIVEQEQLKLDPEKFGLQKDPEIFRLC